MDGRQKRSAAETAITQIKEQSGMKTRRSLQAQVLGDVRGNVPAEKGRGRRKSAPIAEDEQKMVSKRPAEETKTASPKKRNRKSAQAVESAQKTTTQMRGRKSAAMTNDVQPIANQKTSDERKSVSPKKRSRKSATVVNGQEVAMTADIQEQITPNPPKKPSPKSARAKTTQQIKNQSPAKATSSTDKEIELQEIIMRKYFHISERLRIDTSAKCLGNLVNCAKTHTKDVSFCK